MTYTEVQNFIKAWHFFLVPDDILDYGLSTNAFMVFSIYAIAATRLARLFRQEKPSAITAAASLL